MRIVMIIGAISVMYDLFLRLVNRHVAFSSFFLVIGLGLMGLGISEYYFHLPIFTMLPIQIKILLGIMVMGFSFSFIAFILKCSLCSKRKYDNDFEVIVVFGAGLFQDVISRSLKVRLDKAYQLAIQCPLAIIIVTGGQGKNETVSEALAMADYLIQKGIASERIILEDQSTTSYENLVYALKKYDFRQQKTALVSNQFHLYRIENLAKKLGIQGVGVSGYLHSVALPVFYTREYFALLKAYLTRKI